MLNFLFTRISVENLSSSLTFIYTVLALNCTIRDSIVASIPACHAGDRGSIPRRGAFFFF